MEWTATLAYWPTQRPVTHLLAPRRTVGSTVPALCGKRPRAARWLKRELDDPAVLCSNCVKRAKLVDLRIPELPDPCPSGGLTVDTDRGDVDLVAVEAMMTGHRHRLNQAEASYLLTTLVRSLRDDPPDSGAGKMHDRGDQGPSNPSWDRRVQLAADGFGISAKAMYDRICKHKSRWGYELPRGYGA